MYVVAQRFQRRDVNRLHLVGECALSRGAYQRVDGNEKRRQRLARPGGRGDKDIAARADFRPAETLRLGGGAEAAREPFANQWVKRIQHGYNIRYALGS